MSALPRTAPTANHCSRPSLNSPSHRANLLNPEFDVAGIGVFVDADGWVWTTHVFVALPPTTTTTTTTTPTTTTSTIAVTTTTAVATTVTTTTTTVVSTTAATTTTTVAITTPVASPSDTTTSSTTAAVVAGVPDPTTTTDATGQTPPTTVGAGDDAPMSAGIDRSGSAAARADALPARTCPPGSCGWGPLFVVVLGLAGVALVGLVLWAVRL